MTGPDDPAVDDQRHRPRWVLLVATAVVAIAVLAIGVGGWRWRADRASVGTSTDATIMWEACLNGIFWTDPSGVRWWAGHDPVVGTDVESEPRRLADSGTIRRTAIGVVHVDSFDVATFTSRTGGTLALVRTDPDQDFLLDCVGAQAPDPTGQTPPPRDLRSGVNGTLVIAAPDPFEDPILTAGTIRAETDGTAVATTTSTDGTFVLYLAPGTYTLTATVDDGGCVVAPHTVMVGQDAMVSAGLICRADP